jgi:hypothetical protein
MRMHRCCLLAMLALLLVAPSAQAKAPRSPAGPPPLASEEYLEPGPSYGPGPGMGYGHGADPQCCLDGCADCQQDCCGDHSFCLAAGFAFVFLQPHFENDVAFTTTTDDGRFVNIADTSFDYDQELGPRVWLELCKPNQLGFRVTYWRFDHPAPGREAVVNETGLDTISAPLVFRDIDISATQPGDIFRAAAGLDIDVLDFEGTKWTDFCSWQFGTTAGLRYASIQQTYQAAVLDVEETLLDFLESSHRFDGLGPTFSLEARRPMGCLTWFSMARGSLLYGNGKSGFSAFEDITPAAVGRTSFARLSRNDVVTVAEVQLGMEWCKQCCNGKRFFCRTALEGQVWQGVGNATQEDGDLGLFGFHVALGMTL